MGSINSTKQKYSTVTFEKKQFVYDSIVTDGLDSDLLFFFEDKSYHGSMATCKRMKE